MTITLDWGDTPAAAKQGRTPPREERAPRGCTALLLGGRWTPWIPRWKRGTRAIVFLGGVESHRRAWVNDEGGKGTLVCMVCQTDFVILEGTPQRPGRTPAEVSPTADVG